MGGRREGGGDPYISQAEPVMCWFFAIVSVFLKKQVSVLEHPCSPTHATLHIVYVMIGR